jgi:hypothetical protein
MRREKPPVIRAKGVPEGDAGSHASAVPEALVGGYAQDEMWRLHEALRESQGGSSALAPGGEIGQAS